jgi:uncharacterized membrane protein
MRKQDFIKELRLNLSFLPKEEIDDRISFYSELIDDKIEEGVKEEDAIKSIGSIDEIINQIIDEMPLSKIAKDKIKPKRKLSGLEIALIIVGSPIWLSLLLSLIAVLFSLYIIGWSIVISIWAILISLIAVLVAGIVLTIISLFSNIYIVALSYLGATLVILGLTILMHIASKIVTKTYVKLTKLMLLNIKKKMLKRGEK